MRNFKIESSPLLNLFVARIAVSISNWIDTYVFHSFIVFQQLTQWRIIDQSDQEDITVLCSAWSISYEEPLRSVKFSDNLPRVSFKDTIIFIERDMTPRITGRYIIRMPNLPATPRVYDSPWRTALFSLYLCTTHFCGGSSWIGLKLSDFIAQWAGAARSR